MATNTHNPALDSDLDSPENLTYEFAQFGAGCFWGVELAFQRLPGVIKTEGNDVGAQYRSGIYYYNDKQADLAKESKEAKQRELNGNVVTEILPAKRFYRAEEYHQQYLEKGGGHGIKQSAEKGCTDPIRCYG